MVVEKYGFQEFHMSSFEIAQKLAQKKKALLVKIIWNVKLSYHSVTNYHNAAKTILK